MHAGFASVGMRFAMDTDAVSQTSQRRMSGPRSDELFTGPRHTHFPRVIDEVLELNKKIRLNERFKSGVSISSAHQFPYTFIK